MEPIGKAFGDFFVVLGDFMSGILKAVEPHLPMITKILGIGVKTMFFPLFLGMKALTTVLKFFTPGGGANSESEYTEETSTEDTYSHEGGKELKDMMEDSRTADSDYKYDPKEEKSKGGFYDGFAKGGWINGPQSGYPVSLDGGKSTSFIGHGKEYVAQKSSGGAFVVPFDTPATRKNKGLTSMRMRQALMGGFLPTYSKGGKLQEKSEGGEVDMDNLVNMGMDAMKQHFGITNTVAPNPALQAELDEENNKKLPLGLKMTQDGQNIDLGRAAADQVRMVVDMAQDPKYAEKLKEIGKQYGYENMTAEQFKEIGEEIAQDVKFQTNQFIPGTESHRLAQVASSINSSGSRLESAKQDETSKKKELQVAAMSGGGGGVNVVNAPPIDTGGGAEDVPLALPGEERHDSHDYMMPKFGLIQESMINPSELM